jgi:hypothetical protein
MLPLILPHQQQNLTLLPAPFKRVVWRKIGYTLLPWLMKLAGRRSTVSVTLDIYNATFFGQIFGFLGIGSKQKTSPIAQSIGLPPPKL